MATDKSQEIAKQAGQAAKKAGRTLGKGLMKLSSKVKETASSFKEGLSDDDASAPAPEEQQADYGFDETEPESGEETPKQSDYSLDE